MSEPGHSFKEVIARGKEAMDGGAGRRRPNTKKMFPLAEIFAKMIPTKGGGWHDQDYNLVNKTNSHATLDSAAADSSDLRGSSWE